MLISAWKAKVLNDTYQTIKTRRTKDQGFDIYAYMRNSIRLSTKHYPKKKANTQLLTYVVFEGVILLT